jgi:hypothetical protein
LNRRSSYRRTRMMEIPQVALSGDGEKVMEVAAGFSFST